MNFKRFLRENEDESLKRQSGAGKGEETVGSDDEKS